MTLTTHIAIASAITRPFWGNPLLTFFLAFVSHFLADMIPHWDYKLKTIIGGEENFLEKKLIFTKKRVVHDILLVGLDIVIGTGLILLIEMPPFSPPYLLPITFAVLGAIIPDALQPLYLLIRKEPLTSYYIFHHRVHTPRKLRNERKHVIGIITQLLVLAAALGATVLLK